MKAGAQGRLLAYARVVTLAVSVSWASGLVAVVAPIGEAWATGKKTVAPPTRAQADVTGCEGAPPPAWGSGALSLLAVELAPDGVACCENAGPASDAALLRVSLAAVCAPAAESQVDVRVVDEALGRTVGRRIDLADVPAAARARTLALAVAEAVRGVRHDNASVPASADGVAANTQHIAAEAPAALTLSLSAGPVVRLYPRTDTAAWGGGLGAEVARGLAWSELGVGLTLAHRDLPEGNVQLRLLGLSLGAGARARWDATTLGAGPQLTLDRVQIAGTPSAVGVLGNRGDGWAVALLARVVLARELGHGFRLWGATAFGSVLRGVDARFDDQRVAGISGPVWSLALGLGYGALRPDHVDASR